MFEVVVRNALQADAWGNEEKEGKIPFEKGVGADLKIINEEYAFQVFSLSFCFIFKLKLLVTHGALMLNGWKLMG